MKKVMIGNHAVSQGVRLARARFISAYPITPQTQIVEELSELVARGELDARFLKVESEHSAMAACIGAQTTGVRSFTATSSQGLLLMHEMLHWAAGARLPIVLANVSRAVAPGWNIWCDHSDALSQRDTGWLQIFCESNQETLDTVLQAYLVAETVSLPVMIVLDAFYLSHTSEPVDVPTVEEADAYLPPLRPLARLDTAEPFTFNSLLAPDTYAGYRHRLVVSARRAVEEVEAAGRAFGEQFGRAYGALDPYRLEGASVCLICSGTAAATARVAVDALRERGQPVGLLRLRLFRPFPGEAVRRALQGIGRVAILDRAVSPGAGGILAQEVRSVLYDVPEAERPEVVPCIAGIGGRDITPDTITRIFETALTDGPYPEDGIWVDLRADELEVAACRRDS